MRTRERWFAVVGIVLALAGCKRKGNEGYLLTYLDTSDHIHIRYSADANGWHDGSFPSDQQFTAVGTGVDASGVVYLLGARGTDDGLEFWTGVGASSWELVSATDGTSPQGGAPSIAYLAPGRWLVALRTSGGTLALHVYNSSDRRWEGGNVAPETQLTTNLVGDPHAVAVGGRVLVTWLNSSEQLMSAVGTIGSNGSPSFPPGGVQPIPLPARPLGEPLVSVGAGNRFLLGYVGALPSKPQVLVLSSADGTTWPTDGQMQPVPNPENAQSLQLRGMAGRSDGSVLVISVDPATGFNTRRSNADNTWSVLASPFGAAPSGKLLSLMRTGRPAGS